MAVSTDDLDYEWPADMASTSSLVEASTDGEAAAEPESVHTVELLLHYDSDDTPALDKQAVVLQETEEELKDVEFGTEKAAFPEGANLTQTSVPLKAALEPQAAVEVVEMDTQEGPTHEETPSEGIKAPAKAGYDCTFLDPELASEYNCAICLSVSRDPQQTKCCGSTFCLYCIQVALASAKVSSCPVCNSSAVELIPDKAQKQKINKLKVCCPLEGCSWIVELADVETHKRVPHPLSPPQLGHQGSTRFRESQHHYYNTLPAQPHRRQQQQQLGTQEKAGKRPIPTPRVPKPAKESGSHEFPEYINSSFLEKEAQPSAEGPKHSELHEYLNLTLTRPRNRPESSPPESKKPKLTQDVNPATSVTPLPEQQNEQVPLEKPRVQLTDQGELLPLTVTEPGTASPQLPSLYENIAHCDDQQKGESVLDSMAPNHSDTQREMDNVSGIYMNVTTPRPRIPRDCSPPAPPNVAPCEDTWSPQPSTPSPQELPQPPHLSPLQSVPDALDSLPPTNMSVASPAFAELEMLPVLPVSPPATLAELPDAIDPVSPDPSVPSLPPDLLALLDDPNSPLPSQPQGVGMSTGLPLSPTASPQLQTHLLTLPEQLLNMIKPPSHENDSPSPHDLDADYVNAPFSPSDAMPDAEYVNTASLCVENSPLHNDKESDPDSPLHEEATMFDYVPMSPQREATQPGYVNMAHQQSVPEIANTDYVPMAQPPTSSGEYFEVKFQQTELEAPAADYVPMSPPAETIQEEYAEVMPAQRQGEPNDSPQARATSSTSESSDAPLLENTDQHEYEDVLSELQGRETADTTVLHFPPPTSVDVVVALPQAQAPPESYDTTPATVGSESTVEHVYEPLPPPRPPSSSPPPEEPDQALYTDIPALPPNLLPPLPASSATDSQQNQTTNTNTQDPQTSSPPDLPLRSPNLTEPEQDVPEQVPPVPPRPASPTSQPQRSAMPQSEQEGGSSTAIETAPTNTPRPAGDEPLSQVEEGLAVLDHIVLELQQGSAGELTDLPPPPQYDDLSQAPRYTDLVQFLPAVPQLQGAPPGDIFIIRNTGTNTPTQQRGGPLRADNVNIEYEMGDQDHHRNKTMRKTQTLL